MEYKIICTGNIHAPSITHYLQKLYPDTTFISRSTGYDLSTDTGLQQFKELLPNYNVFINHSQLVPGAQETLLKYAHEKWTAGHVINLGSILEFEKWSWHDPAAAEEKRSLRELSLALSDELFKTTHLIVGGLQTADNDFILQPEKVANIIKMIIESDCHIPLMYVDNINTRLTNQYLSCKLT